MKGHSHIIIFFEYQEEPRSYGLTPTAAWYNGCLPYSGIADGRVGELGAGANVGMAGSSRCYGYSR